MAVGPTGKFGPTGKLREPAAQCARFGNYSHGFSPDGRYYAYASPGYRVLVDTMRFMH